MERRGGPWMNQVGDARPEWATCVSAVTSLGPSGSAMTVCAARGRSVGAASDLTAAPAQRLGREVLEPVDLG
jgi:hypothetical protein